MTRFVPGLERDVRTLLDWSQDKVDPQSYSWAVELADNHEYVESVDLIHAALVNNGVMVDEPTAELLAGLMRVMKLKAEPEA